MDGEFSIVSVSDIKKGEEITISYNWSLSMKNRQTRQNIIQERYHFKCSCQFCKEEEKNSDALKIYKDFDKLVEDLEDLKPKLNFWGIPEKQDIEDLKKQLIIWKKMYQLGKSKNLAPSGIYEITNEGFIAAFKIVCNVDDDDREFKIDAKKFATEGEKLQKLYNFSQPEPGEWKKRMVDPLLQ